MNVRQWSVYAFLLGVITGGSLLSFAWYCSADAEEADTGYTRIHQVGIIVRDVADMAKKLEQVGFKNIRVRPRNQSGGEFDQYYHGKAVQHGVWQGFWRGEGDTMIELITPVGEPSEWADFLQKHGEGLHHFAVSVTDLPKELQKYEAAGWDVLQTGKWPMKDGYGAFAYVRPKNENGPVIEIVSHVKQ